ARACTDHAGCATFWNVRRVVCTWTLMRAGAVRKKRKSTKSRYPSPFGLTVAGSGLSRRNGGSVETERYLASGTIGRGEGSGYGSDAALLVGGARTSSGRIRTPQRRRRTPLRFCVGSAPRLS